MRLRSKTIGRVASKVLERRQNLRNEAQRLTELGVRVRHQGRLRAEAGQDWIRELEGAEDVFARASEVWATLGDHERAAELRDMSKRVYDDIAEFMG